MKGRDISSNSALALSSGKALAKDSKLDSKRDSPSGSSGALQISADRWASGQLRLPAGKTSVCRSNAPIDGVGLNRVWIVLEGMVDLFAVQQKGVSPNPDDPNPDDPKATKQDGPRHALFRIGSGGLICGLPSLETEARLVLTGSLNALVLETTLEALLAEITSGWSDSLDVWLTSMSRILYDNSTPWGGLNATEPVVMDLGKDDEVFGPEHGVLWAETGAARMRWRCREHPDF